MGKAYLCSAMKENVMPAPDADTPTTSSTKWVNERKQVEVCMDLIHKFRRLDPDLQRWALERLKQEGMHAVQATE